MSRATELLERATPLPWPIENCGDYFSTDLEDALLIEYAVNRLPDYEAAVEALELLDGECTRTDPDYGTCFAPYDYKRPGHAEDPDPMKDWCVPCVARWNLQPLRDKVPADV